MVQAYFVNTQRKREKRMNIPVDTPGKRRARVSWRCMKRRCRDINFDSYFKYGARGITICARWSRFENFLADMGERPEGTTLDRIDSKDNYGPENCRWATAIEQRANRRADAVDHSQSFSYGGTRYTPAELARIAGISRAAMYGRLVVSGWPVERSINEPVRHKQSKVKAA